MFYCLLTLLEPAKEHYGVIAIQKYSSVYNNLSFLGLIFFKSPGHVGSFPIYSFIAAILAVHL